MEEGIRKQLGAQEVERATGACLDVASRDRRNDGLAAIRSNRYVGEQAELAIQDPMVEAVYAQFLQKIHESSKFQRETAATGSCASLLKPTQLDCRVWLPKKQETQIRC